MQSAVEALQKFGVLRRIFHGTGSIRLGDGSDIGAHFTLAQLANTDLLICADVEYSPLTFQSSRLKIESLQGTLTDGRKISATELWIQEVGAIFSEKARLIIPAGHWNIRDSPINGQVSVVFEVFNFLFLGTEPELRVINGLENGTRITTLTLGGRRVQLRRTTDYNQAVAELSARRGVRVTCTATTTIDPQLEIDSIASMMDTLCDIMSVARGTLVGWASFEIRTAAELPGYSQYRNSVARRYEQLGLIDVDDCENTKRFLEEGFQRCEELGKDLSVTKIARAFIETRAGHIFIESRSLLIAILVEYLASARARLEGQTYFLKKSCFGKGRSFLRAKVEAALKEIYPDISDDHLPLMLERLAELNRRSLKSKLKILDTWLGVGFIEGEIESFVKARNRLAHQGLFPEDGTPKEHYQRMQHFIDRIVLRLFGYRGSYYDFDHEEMRQL